MAEILLERDIIVLKKLVRGDLVGVFRPNVIDERRNHSYGGPFRYYRGEVQHRHHDGTFTVRVIDAACGGIPQTLRFDTTFHAVRSSPQSSERYTLIPWSPEIERQIKLQRLSHVCWFMGRLGWEQLSAHQIDEALVLVNEAFSRLTEAGQGRLKQCAGSLEEVLNVCEEAVLSIDPWRYEVTIMNKAERSSVLQIYPKDDPTPVHMYRQPVAERLFASLEAVVGILAEIGDPFPAVPSDATWRSRFFVPLQSAALAMLLKQKEATSHGNDL